MESEITQNKKHIFIGGMCSLPLGVMERQLGNMAILIPMLKNLHAEFPGTPIVTSLQLSENFCQEHNLHSIKEKSLYSPTVLSGLISLFDWFRSLIFWFFTKLFLIKPSFLLSGSKFNWWLNSEVYLDFSGDTYGDMAYWGHFLKQSLDLLTLRNIGIPVVIYAQSPGPFSTPFKRILGKFTLNRVALITVREPKAYEHLEKLHLRIPIVKTACLAWELEPGSDSSLEMIFRREGITENNLPWVGVNITGFNFSENLVGDDKYKNEREFDELLPIQAIIRYLLDKAEVNVVFIPHVYRTNEKHEMVTGPDGKISEQLYDLIQKTDIQRKDNLHIVRGTYDVQTIKALIGKMDMFIAGRLHASVGAMSQAIPTILLAYSPKHYGFAKLAGVDEYVSNNYKGKFDQDDIQIKIQQVWPNRNEISNQMKEKMNSIRLLVDLNHKIVKDILSLSPAIRINIPDSLVNKWKNWSTLASQGKQYSD